MIYVNIVFCQQRSLTTTRMKTGSNKQTHKKRSQQRLVNKQGLCCINFTELQGIHQIRIWQENCRDRKLPQWVVQEARTLKCPACTDTQRGGVNIIQLRLGEQFQPWQVVVMDVFELHFPVQQQKGRFILMACATMHFMSIVCMSRVKMDAAGTDSGAKIVDTFCNGWLMHRPRPQWIIFDFQLSLAKGQFPEFIQTIGIGSMVTAAEAHWQNGLAEALINSIKRTMRRIRNENTDMYPETVAALAAHANNHSVKQQGFSPIQWAYGCDPDNWQDPMDPLHVNTDKLFGPKTFVEIQQLRDRAATINNEERARSNMTHLLNSSSKPINKYHIGDHVYIWRNATLKARKKDQNYNP